MAGDIERPYPPGTATRHRIQVLETLKGNVGQEIIVLDRFSLFEKNGTYVWGFSPSECPPTLEKDPTGRSAIIGVVPPDNGFILFFLGDHPSGLEYDRMLEQLASAGVTSLPVGGGAPSGGDFPPMPAAALAVVGPLAFLTGAAFLRRRGEPHNG
jgi:hypothetical protein